MSSLDLSNSHQNLFNGLADINYTTCVAYNWNSGNTPKGIFQGEDQTRNHIFPAVTLQFVLSFFISQLIYFLLRPFKQPKFICNILTGIILGPSVLGRHQILWERIFPQREMIVLNTISTLGIIYFIFILSVKMDKARILSTTRNTWRVSVTCLVIPLIITMFLVQNLRNYIPGRKRQSFHYFLSCVLSQTCFAVVANAMSELNLLTSELGRLAISCSIPGELLTWFNLVVATLLRSNKHFIEAAIGMCAILLLIFFVVRPLLRWIIRTTPEEKPVREIYVIGVLILPVITGVLGDLVGSTFMSGALLTGLMIPAGPPLGSAIVEKGELVMSYFFLPFFYIRIGQLVNVYSIDNWEEFAVIEIITTAAYLAKVAACLLSMIFLKTSVRNAIVFSFILNIKGVIELMMLSRWRVRKAIDEQTFTAIVLSYTLMTAIATPIISIYYKPKTRLEAFTSSEQRRRTLQTTPIDSELRILCGIHYEDNVNSMITLLKASNPTEKSPICAYVAHLVELIGRATPLLAPYKEQKRRHKKNATDRIMSAVTKHMRSCSVSATIQPFTVIAPYNTMHECVCSLAEQKLVPFILLPFHGNQEFQKNTASLRQFNINIQKNAPCTVGILVDRGLPRYLRSTHFTYNIAVFFFGGADDREAIALASRMSFHPNLSITVFKIEYKGNQKENNQSENHEKQLDEYVMNDFIERNIGNACVVCRKLAAKDTRELMEAVRSMESDYDLAIVGKRQWFSSELELEMNLWVEYKELGIIGDMIASIDFCRGTMSVLVIQCLRSVSESVLGSRTFSESPLIISKNVGAGEERNPLFSFVK